MALGHLEHSTWYITQEHLGIENANFFPYDIICLEGS